MSIALAYVGVILIWSTTPLAIKWSAEDVSYLFGVTARMSLGAVCLLVLMLLTRKPLPLHAKARRTYLAVALHLYAGMLITYWGARFIPSGWISVIYGLSPFMTALLAVTFLPENRLSLGKLFCYLLGACGLWLMFHSAMHLNQQAIQGMIAILIGAFLQSFSAIWIKRLKAELPALTQISGGMLFSLPVYLLTWYSLEQGQWPETLSTQTQWSIIYLGLIATPIGFALYFYVLTHLSAITVALITLITPVFALFLGYRVNHEPLTLKILAGTSLILFALMLHALLDRRQRLN